MTVRPIVTGQSVLAIRHKTGVVMACDALISYGSWKRFRGQDRYFQASKHVVVCASGEFSDFQYIVKVLSQLKLNRELEAQDPNDAELRPRQVWCYLNRILYNKRCDMNPLWNSVVVAGVDKAANGTDEPFLGYCDLYGTRYEDSVVATAFGAYFGVPKMREAVENEDLTEEEARKVLRDSMAVLAGRDCNASAQVSFAIIDADGVRYESESDVNSNWDVAGFHAPSSGFDIAGSTW
eukprot:GHVH01000143.1.p1 GENE.GHVH01000143.1~~GHVH01000143.1.p1  ORF type:complete len:271 (-),score=39.49 GHVH01000143.1:55-765(-)